MSLRVIRSLKSPLPEERLAADPYSYRLHKQKFKYFTKDDDYERILCGTFEYFVWAFLYPRKLGLDRATINLTGASRDLYQAQAPIHYRYNGRRRFLMEEIMARYRKTARDKIIEKANARKNQGNGSKALTFKNLPKDMKVEFWKPTKAIHNLDIIGYVLTDPDNPDCDDKLKPGYLWYGRNYWVHKGIGTDDDTVVCLAKTFGERCPICEYAKQRRASGEASKEELDALKPKQRQLFNVIDRDSDDKSVKLFDNSYHLFGKQLDKEILDSEDEEVAEFFEPTSGFTLRVRFEKKSFNGREFFECDRIDFKDRKKQYPESIVDETYPLDDLLNRMSYDQLNELFVMGAEIETDEERVPEKRVARMRQEKANEEREEAVRERRSKGGRRNPEPEPEEDDEDVRGSEDGGADDDTPPPSRGRGGRSRKSEPEDDDGDDDKPVRTGRGRKADKRDENEDEDDVPFEDEKPRGRGRPKRVEPEPEPDEEPDSEPEEEAPKPRGRGRASRTEKDEDDGNKCPSGLRWGKDCDTADECDDCKKWAACNAANRKSGR